jgi:hypothetical protein
MQLVTGYQATQILFVVAKHSFADILKDGPKTGEEVAQIAKTDPVNTNRVLRAAASVNVFSRDPVSLKYDLTDISRALIDGPGSYRYVVLHLGGELCFKGWSHLDTALVTGETPFKAATGGDYWTALQANPVSADRFNRAMTTFSGTLPITKVITELGIFKDTKHLTDVGGGQGVLLVSILRQNPHLRGTNFDLPSVVEDAKSKNLVDHSDVASRFEYASGSFFEAVPAADAYVLKSIIHDWEDAKAIEILKTIRKSLPDHGKVVLIEMVLKETGQPQTAFLDVHMMVLLNAKERTEEEFAKSLKLLDSS